MTSPQQPLPPLAQGTDVATSLGVAGVSALPSTMQIRMETTLAKVSRRFRKEAQRFFTPGEYTHTLKIQRGAVRLMEVPNRIIRVRVKGLRLVDYSAWNEGGEDWALWEEGGDPGGFSDLEGGPSARSGEDFNGLGQGRWVVETPGGVDNLNYPPPAQNHPFPGFKVESNWLVWKDWDFWRLNGRDVEVTYSWDTLVPQDVITAVADIAGRNLTIDPMSAVRQSKLLMTRHFRQEMADWVMDGSTGFTPDDIAQAQSYRYPAPPMIVADMSFSDMEPSAAFLSDSSW